jgi:hypothetical protein
MLHHPFVDWEDLLLIDGQAYMSYIDAFRARSQLHSHPEYFYTDHEDDNTDLDTDSETEDDLDPDNGSDAADYPLADFETFAR